MFYFGFVLRINFSRYRVPRLTITLFLLHFKYAVPFSSGFHYLWEGFYFSLITLLQVIFSSGCIKKSLSLLAFWYTQCCFLTGYNLFESVVWYLSSFGRIFSASCFGCCSILFLLLWDHSYHIKDISTMSLCFLLVSVFLNFCAPVYICSCESFFISLIIFVIFKLLFIEFSLLFLIYKLHLIFFFFFLLRPGII